MAPSSRGSRSGEDIDTVNPPPPAAEELLKPSSVALVAPLPSSGATAVLSVVSRTASGLPASRSTVTVSFFICSIFAVFVLIAPFRYWYTPT